ncbi:MAG: trypsin-like peptidase domain-containing protein [Acidobacteriaceae bacterium]|jgi:serine protease Do|nr:trypsin-like peptidase domain-containing protein [Acidobacteriaceae bacterium]
MLRKLLVPFLLVITGLCAGLVLSGRMSITSESDASPAPQQAPRTPSPSVAPAARPQTPPAATGGLPAATGAIDFTKVAGQSVKAVANISSLQVVRRPNSPFASDPFFQYFFGDQQDVFGSRDRRSTSLGSGAIVSSDGFIVTNNHVVGENMREITVAFADKREVPGRLIGTDPATDIALIKVDVTGLPSLPWGDSSKLQVGEWVLAIGSPFQLSQTVTAGIVSATGRANVGFAEYEDFIQTDAAINPGNSGGALVNTRGELVGINTGIFSQSGGYQGIGFAVPSNLARHVIDDLSKYGEVRRGTIGGIITIDKLTPELAGQLGTPSTDGALIVRMASASEAYNAGVRPGDVIVRFNTTNITDPSQLFRLVADARIGSTATIRVIRNGHPLDFHLPIVADTRGRR